MFSDLIPLGETRVFNEAAGTDSLSFIDFIKGGFLFKPDGGTRELTGRHGLGFVQAYSILTQEAHIKHGGMPIRIKDSLGDNFALSVVDY